MIITAWIILICFGLFSITSIYKYLKGGMSTAHGVLMFISIIITALAAGVQFGGLFNLV